MRCFQALKHARPQARVTTRAFATTQKAPEQSASTSKVEYKEPTMKEGVQPGVMISQERRTKALNVRQGGRGSVSGVVATVFGATGMLGSQVVDYLGGIGSQVVVPYRGDFYHNRKLKVGKELGQIIPVNIDMVDEDSIRRAIERSNVVINCLGKDHSTKNFSLHDVNVKCTHRIAKICEEMGVERFVHVSHMNASMDSKSEFLRTKAEGEAVVRDFLPDATILRVAPIFGMLDQFVNRMCSMLNWGMFYPTINGGVQKIQPVYAQDVANAVLNVVVSGALGQTFHIGGPKVWTRKELLEHLVYECYMEEGSRVIDMPSPMAQAVGFLLDNQPFDDWRMLTRDEVLMMETDFVVPEGVQTIQDLGITPRALEDQIYRNMQVHRYNRAPMYGLEEEMLSMDYRRPSKEVEKTGLFR